MSASALMLLGSAGGMGRGRPGWCLWSARRTGRAGRGRRASRSASRWLRTWCCPSLRASTPLSRLRLTCVPRSVPAGLHFVPELIMPHSPFSLPCRCICPCATCQSVASCLVLALIQHGDYKTSLKQKRHRQIWGSPCSIEKFYTSSGKSTGLGESAGRACS